MKRLGILIPATNIVIEKEIYSIIISEKFLFDNVTAHFSRLEFNTRYSVNKRAYFTELYENIPCAIRRFKNLDIDTFGFFCTSASLYNLEKFSQQDEVIINPIESLRLAISRLKTRNGLLISPYCSELTEQLKSKISPFQCIKRSISLNLSNRIEFESFNTDGLEKLLNKEVDNSYDFIVVLCTNISTLHLIEKVEARYGIPILTSNQSLFWQMINTINMNKNLSNRFGEIFKYKQE